MKFLKTVFKDILFISKVTGTQKKKILIGISVIFSQLSVITDVFLIGLFAFLIAGQKTNIEIVDNLSDFFDENRILILFLVFFRFIFLFLQSYILRRIELTVTNNLKEYILKHICTVVMLWLGSCHGNKVSKLLYMLFYVLHHP